MRVRVWVSESEGEGEIMLLMNNMMTVEVKDSREDGAMGKTCL